MDGGGKGWRDLVPRDQVLACPAFIPLFFAVGEEDDDDDSVRSPFLLHGNGSTLVLVCWMSKLQADSAALWKLGVGWSGKVWTRHLFAAAVRSRARKYTK
jgi:hypothetical protein